MVESRFDDATIACVLDEGRAGVDLDPQWNVDGRILNGGYLQAVTVRAAGAVLGGSGEPVAISTSFAAPAGSGPATVAVELLRRGRRLSTVSAILRQGDAVVLASLVTFGSLPDGHIGGAGSDGQLAGPLSSRVSGAAPVMPMVPEPDECLRVPADRMPGPPGLASVVDLAFVPADSGWLSGDTSAGPAIRCWLSFTDHRPIDPLAVTALADMAPPVSFAQGRFGWAPTLHLQVGLFARPRGEHVLLDLRGEPYDGAFVAEDGLLWDRDGTLVARSRQIAMPPRD